MRVRKNHRYLDDLLDQAVYSFTKLSTGAALLVDMCDKLSSLVIRNMTRAKSGLSIFVGVIHQGW